MTTKQRNLLIFCGVMLVIWMMSRAVSSQHQAQMRHEQAMRAAALQRQRQAQKPAPAPPPPPPAVKTAPAVSNTPSKFAGVWRGRAAIENRGICNLRLELTDSGENKFTGYSLFTCVNTNPLMAQKDKNNQKTALINRLDPDSAILTGKLQDGAIHFTSEKNIGTDINGCAVTSFTLTPFGADRLAAEWQAGDCKGGNMLLGRARN